MRTRHRLPARDGAPARAHLTALAPRTPDRTRRRRRPFPERPCLHVGVHGADEPNEQDHRGTLSPKLG